jgi:hypothetical protein
LVIDGEAVVLGVDGVADFDALHTRKHDAEVQFYAFDIPVPRGLRHGPGGAGIEAAGPALSGRQVEALDQDQESKASRVRASEGSVRIGPQFLQRRSWRGYRVPDLTFAIAVNLNSGVSLRAYRSTLASS